MKYVQEVNVFQIASFVRLCIHVLPTPVYARISLVRLLTSNALRNPVLLTRRYAGMENV